MSHVFLYIKKYSLENIVSFIVKFFFHIIRALTVENEKTEIFKNLPRKRCLKIFVNVRKLPADVVQKNPPPTFLEDCTFDILKTRLHLETSDV